MNRICHKLTALLLAAGLVWVPAVRPRAQAATPESAATPETAPVATAEYAAPAATPQATPAPEADAPAPLAQAGLVTDGVSPIGTTINLFDYWITTRDAPDNVNPPDMNQGINKDHALQFTASARRGPGINDYTGSSAPRPGIVQDTLQNGYPVLRVDGQSLDYLFNPALPTDGKASYAGVRNLLQIDPDRYYYYNSTQNFAQFDETTNSFLLYDAPGVRASGAIPLLGQFFPFNIYEEVKDLYARNPAINHYFGVTMTTRFVQQPYGTVDGTPGSTPVTYEFTGDDDVWVFIDDVLVGDLGGIHDAASLRIDFETGAIAINNRADGTLRDKFAAAGKPWTNPDSATFADNTYHTLKFFYLERGNVDSNMMLKFNLVSIPQSDLIKVDQIGDPVPGARFALFYADDTYQPLEQIASGVTEADGTFVFQNPDGTLLSLNNLKNEYGGTGRSGKFVLREEEVPAGYRAPGDMQLYFPEDFPDLATLLSGNPWTTGAYASPMVTVTLPDTVEDLQGQTYPADSGLYFAVVLKRQNAAGDGSSARSNWYPVYGDPIDGWQVAGGTTLQNVLQAARANPYLFVLDSSGAYKDTIENLPGDILTYYYVLATNGKLTDTDAQYTLGFYRTSAATLADATPANTVRLDADLPDAASGFQREFSVRLFVPDLKNYLFVQKVAEDNQTPLTGATFALYRAADVTDGTVTPGAQPFDTVTTRDLSQEQGDVITLGGAGVFPNRQPALPAGTYYLKEITAPAGYAPSEELVEVIVDNTDVYADAGTAGDAVTVLRGVGKIVRSMLQFAVPDDINATLTDIYAALYTAPAYTPGTGNDWAVWTAAAQAPLALSYYANNQILEYGPTQPGDPVYFAVNAGWSRLKITQNYAAGTDQALKIDLGDQDLTGLFARSTIVQVRNQSTRLVLQKFVTGPLGETARPFPFVLQLRDADGQPLAGRYGGLTFSDQGIAETALADGGEVTLRDLPVGSVCTIEEQAVPHYETTVAVDGGTPAATREITVTTRPGLTSVVFTNHSTLTPSPTPEPTAGPTPAPTATPTAPPTASPTPTGSPAVTPTASPAAGPGSSPTPAGRPTAAPSARPSPGLTALPATGDPFSPVAWAGAAAGAAAILWWLRRRRR